MLLTEIFKEDTWQTLNSNAKNKFGEFGVMTCSEEEIAELVDLPAANKIAKEMFGEFGFATLDEDQAKELILKHPELVKK